MVLDADMLERYRKETPESSTGATTTLDVVQHFNKIHRRNFTFVVLDERIAAVPSVIYFRKNSYLVDVFNEKLGMIHNAGLIEHWQNSFMQSYFLNVKQTPAGPAPFGVHQLTGPLMVLVFGLFLAIGAFVVELVKASMEQLRKHKSHKNAQQLVD